MIGVTVAIFFLVLCLFYLYRKRKMSLFKDAGIPGPEPNLILGNMMEIIRKSPAVCEKEWIKKYGKVVGFFFGGYPYVMVADTEILKKILITDFQYFMNRPLQPIRNDVHPYIDQLVNVRDKRWKDLRSILSPTFTTSKLRQMAITVNSSVDVLLEKIKEKATSNKSFNIYSFYQTLTMEVIGRTAFGFNSNCQKNPNDNLVRSAKVLLSGNLTDTFIFLSHVFPELANTWFKLIMVVLSFQNEAKEPFKDILDSLRLVIKARRETESERRNDLLQSMIDIRMDQTTMNQMTVGSLEATDDSAEKPASVSQSDAIERRMTDDEILGNALLFLIAGYETTSTALAFTTLCLVHHPEVQDKVRQEINDHIKAEEEIDYNAVHKLTYLDQVFNEALRLFPPIYMFTLRDVARDVSYGQLHLKKGMKVFCPTFFLHHDPELWDEPDKFDPDRFSPENKAKQNPMAFQPFGARPRNCIGMRMAKTTAKVALTRVLTKYRLERCEETDKFPPSFRFFVATLQPAKGVHVKAVPV